MPGGETEKDISAWTVDSLKEHMEAKLELIQQHFEARIDNYEKRLLERQAAQQEAISQVRSETARALADADKAISKSENQMEKRFDAVNEFRGQLNDQVKTFLTRETYEVAHEALDGKVDIIQNLITGIIAEKRGGQEQVTERRQDNSSKIGMIVAVATVINVMFVLVANGVFKT